MTNLLAGFVPIKRFAKDVGKTRRTVERWMERDRLPFTQLGGVRLIHLATARAWLMRRMRHDRHGRQKPSKPVRR
jgi:hypothetical protein